LRKVDSGAGDVCPLVHIGDVAHGSAVDAHPQMKFFEFTVRALTKRSLWQHSTFMPVN
jgi:hypothetical protein